MKKILSTVTILVISFFSMAQTDSSTAIKAYSKFDFVPGEKVIGFEDFMTGSIGDFPAGWNTNASAEIVTIEGKPGHWLMFTKAGMFVPEITKALPDNFSLEFDLLSGNPLMASGIDQFTTSITEMLDLAQLISWHTANNRYTFTVTPKAGDGMGGASADSRKNSESEAAVTISTAQFTEKLNPVHISVWRQKERIRVYFNQEKVWDIPKAMMPGIVYNSILFYMHDVDPDHPYYLTNLRLAVGAPDTRNKFLTEGKWVTHGILFDVNSANIKAESYGSLKEIANVLKENADVKVKIIGHTDADGSDPSNLDLSKRRATSVKAALVKEFGIDESRMQTDGKGESEPIDKNDNPAGKANNRRVEFIKL